MAEMMIDDWATETTLEKIRQILEGTIKKGPLDELVKVIRAMAKGEGISADRAKAALEAAKETAEATKEGTDAATKAKLSEVTFRRRMLANGKKVHEEIAKQDIGRHLMDAGGMLAMPIKSMEDAFAKITGLFTAVGADVYNASKALISSFGKIGGAIGSAMGYLGAFGAGLLSISTGAVGYLLGAITAMGDTFFDLYDTGINFAKGLKDGASGLGSMLEVAADARLSLGDFAEYLSKNTAVALRIGAENMAQLSKRVRDTIYPMGMFGMGISEVNEYLGDYLEQQRMAGALETLSQSQRTRAGAAYLEQITMLSQITGKRRKQIAEEMKLNQKSIGLQTYLQGLDADQRQGQMDALNSIQTLMGTLDTTGGMAKDFGDSMYFGTFAATETGKNMIMFGRGQEAQMIQHIQTMVKNGEMSERQAREEMRRVIGHMAANQNAAKQTAMMGAVMGQGAAQGASFTAQSKLLATSFKGVSMALTDAEKTIGSWDEMQNAISMTWTKFMSTLFGGKDGNAFSETMGKISKTFKDLLDPEGENSIVPALHAMADVMANHVVVALEWFKDPKNMEGIKDFLAELPKKIKEFTDGIGSMVEAIKEAIKDFLFTKTEVYVRDDQGMETSEKKVIYGEMKDIGTMFADAIKKIDWAPVILALGAGLTAVFAIGAVTSTAGAAAPAVAGVAAGAGIIAVMASIATGLAAFAPPPVGIGAVVLSTAIVGVGSAIAAATWALGGTLPKLAEGLKSFGNVDGDKLKSVGHGMTVLGSGLWEMGKGFGSAGIGSLVVNFSELLSDKGPFAMLKEFSDILIDPDDVTRNAGIMEVFASAMSDMSDIPVIKTDVIDAVFKAIEKTLGATTDPFAMLKAFSDIIINPANITKNANVMEVFASAMSDMSKIPVISRDLLAGGFLGGAADWLSGDKVKMAWANIKAFSLADLGDTANITKNANAMDAFSTAMAGMSKIPVISRDLLAGGILGGWADRLSGDKVKMAWDNIKAFSLADLGDIADITKNANAMDAFSTAMADIAGIDLASLEAWADSDSMDKISSAFGNLFGETSPLSQIANLDKISTPLATASTSLDSFNPKMKTLYDMLRDPAFVAGAGAIKVLTNNLGGLDDVVNDWSDEELEQFKSITQSLGNFQGAQIKGFRSGQEVQAAKLELIAEKLAEILIAISTGTVQVTTEQKKTTTAVTASGPHMK